MRKNFYIQQHLLLILFTIYIHTNHKDALNWERENEIEREEREREKKKKRESKRGGDRYPCTCREKLHFALPEKSCTLHLQRAV
jgi:hypothetical protein